jgi:hypothetical protein
MALSRLSETFWIVLVRLKKEQVVSNMASFFAQQISRTMSSSSGGS